MKSNHYTEEQLKDKTKEELEVIDHYWVPTSAVVISVSNQLRQHFRRSTTNSNSANVILNKINILLEQCDDEDFVKYDRQGLKPEQEYFKVWDKE